MGENGIRLNFGKIDGEKKILTPKNINGVSKEYLLEKAKAAGDEGQIALINSVFANKEINADGDEILDAQEWEKLQNLLIDDKKLKDDGYDVNKVSGFVEKFGLNKKEVDKADVFNVFNYVSDEDDNIVSVKSDNGEKTIQYKDGKSLTYTTDVEGKQILTRQVSVKDGVTTTSFFEADGVTPNKIITVDEVKNQTVVSESANGKTVVKQYNGLEADEQNLAKVFVQQGKVKTEYVPDDVEFKKPLLSIENEGLPNQITSEYEYTENGSTIINKKDAANKKICVEYHGIDSNGYRVYQRIEGLQMDVPDGVPSHFIRYDNNEPPNKIREVINDIDPETGEWKSVKHYKNGELVVDFDCRVDGKFTKVQQGIGDCYLCAPILALAATEKGSQTLSENITITKDENGQKIYKVKFPGASIARSELMKKYPKAGEKITIQGEYTVTQKEMNNAFKNMVASHGDGDFLLMELAYAKFQDDLNETTSNLGIKVDRVAHKPNNLEVREHREDELDMELIVGGLPQEVLFLVTGERSRDYYNANRYLNRHEYSANERPGFRIDFANGTAEYIDCSKLKMKQESVRRNTGKSDVPRGGKTKDPYDVMLIEVIACSTVIENNLPKRGENQYDTIMKEVVEYSKDGVMDEASVMATFNVSYDGQRFGSHVVRVVKADKEYVWIEDSNNPNFVPIKVPVADFKKGVATMIMKK